MNRRHMSNCSVPDTPRSFHGMKAGMNLAEVISAVPQLGISCSTVLTDGTSGSGVKLLRLVSKQLRASMLGVLQGYTLQLNGSGAGLEDQMGLLQHARLSRLLVVVTDDANGGLFVVIEIGSETVFAPVVGENPKVALSLLRIGQKSH